MRGDVRARTLWKFRLLAATIGPLRPLAWVRTSTDDPIMSKVGEMTDNLRKEPPSRRAFIKWVGGVGAGFVLFTSLPGGMKRALAQVPGGTLDPSLVPKYRTPMMIPRVMPRARRVPSGCGN